MQPRPIDTTTWARRPWFEHYLETSPCTYAVTVELDVTAFEARRQAVGLRGYAGQIWALATVIQGRAEFRMTLTEEGRPAVWDVVHPAYTVFRPESETFVSLWTPYEADPHAFQDAMTATIDSCRDAADLRPQRDTPPNVFDVSSLPWLSFTGFTLDIPAAGRHLAPIVTFGGYVRRGERTLLPAAFQVHHAVADGFHTARLVSDLQALLDDPSWL